MISIIPNWHPLFVHFTVAILFIVGVLQLLRWVSKPVAVSASVVSTQKVLVILGVVAVAATLATGLQAYYSVNHDTPSHLAMTDHRNWAFATATAFLLGALFYVVAPHKRQLLAGSFFVIALVLVSATAFKGGELVYRHGLGVMSLPQVTGEGHDHEHAPGEEHAPAAKAADNHETHAHGGNGDEEVAAVPKPAADSHGNHDHGAAAEPTATSEKKVHVHADGKAHDHGSTLFSGLDSEAAQVVQAFHRAINSGNAAVARAQLADKVVIFEGGNVERSADQYASHHMLSDMKFLAAMKLDIKEHQVRVMGDSAVSLASTQISGSYKDKAINITSMETMVLKQHHGKWEIIHIHWSN